MIWKEQKGKPMTYPFAGFDKPAIAAMAERAMGYLRLVGRYKHPHDIVSMDEHGNICEPELAAIQWIVTTTIDYDEVCIAALDIRAERKEDEPKLKADAERWRQWEEERKAQHLPTDSSDLGHPFWFSCVRTASKWTPVVTLATSSQMEFYHRREWDVLGSLAPPKEMECEYKESFHERYEKRKVTA